MISIIICSRTQTINKDLSENIKNTIGCNFELIVIDNSENQYSIFEAYNLGIEKSVGDYLCFMHDDIFIHTIGWGKSLLRIFNEDVQIGIIGVAGSKIKTKMPSAWWDCPEEQTVIHIIQHFPNKEKEKMGTGFENNSNTEVVVIDGVFMATRKDNKIRFNKTMTGFHNYDLNISFEYKKKGYKVIVTNEILIEHYSTGNINGVWVESAYKIHQIYKNDLPLKIQSTRINKGTEIANAKFFIEECIKFKKYNIAYSVWWKLFCLHPNINYHIQFRKTILSKKQC